MPERAAALWCHECARELGPYEYYYLRCSYGGVFIKHHSSKYSNRQRRVCAPCRAAGRG